MPKETIASLMAQHKAEVAELNGRIATLVNAVADANRSVLDRGHVIMATDRTGEALRARVEAAESDVSLLRGFALAKLSSAELDALPIEFSNFLRDGRGR